VRGKLTFNPWLDREGNARVSADVVLQDFEFAGGNAAKTAQEAAEETIPAQENNQMMTSEVVIEDTEERAEMLAAVHEMDSLDEAFAGQY
jgi:single-stranded DNA-binding protein